MKYLIQAKVSDTYGRTVESVSSIAHFMQEESRFMYCNFCYLLYLYIVVLNLRKYIHFIDGRWGGLILVLVQKIKYSHKTLP